MQPFSMLFRNYDSRKRLSFLSVLKYDEGNPSFIVDSPVPKLDLNPDPFSIPNPSHQSEQ